jgi:hypothetical protein
MILAQVEIDAHFGQHGTMHESGSWGAPPVSYLPNQEFERRGGRQSRNCPWQAEKALRIRQLIMQSAWE